MNKGKKAGESRALPGKRSSELLKLREKFIPEAVFQVAPVFIERGRGAIIEDVDGNEYIDFAGGICVLNVGQSNEAVISAIKDQIEKHLHADHNVTMYESYVKLAQRLTEITPGKFPKQVLFSNSGAEGIENAVKIARRYTGRYGLICFEGRKYLAAVFTLNLNIRTLNRMSFSVFNDSF